MNSDAPGATATALTAPNLNAPDLNSSGMKQPYHLVDPSPWPLLAAFGAGAIVLGIIFAAHFGNYTVLSIGLIVVLAVAFMWWRDVLKESQTAGLHTPVVRLGLRYGMTLFIASEVMFFVGFFWAYFHFALYPVHVSGAEHAVWPPEGIRTFDPFHLPLMNTLILLLSGTAVTWAHYALLHGQKKYLVMGLGFTILLGLSFTTFQALEYSEAPFKFAGGGVYPSVFFLATGFHGFHVIVGTIFLIVCWWRARGGGFTATRHFGFEAAAWYWHFVDVVWLFLFVVIYLWGAGPSIAE
jgi:cytochrome c oxidase subunit 3